MSKNDQRRKIACCQRVPLPPLSLSLSLCLSLCVHVCMYVRTPHIDERYYININNSRCEIFLLCSRRYSKLTSRRGGIGTATDHERWGGGRGRGGGLVQSAPYNDILAIKPVNIFLYRCPCTITKLHKGSVRIVNFLKIPPANVQSRGYRRFNARGAKIGICGNYSPPDFALAVHSPLFLP